MGVCRMEATKPQLPKSQQRLVDEFWRQQQEETEGTVDFSERLLPMARVKKIVGADEDDMKISVDTPAFLAKLCELFVQELTVRAWACAESHQRRIILDSDVAVAIASTDCYRFLINALARYLTAQGGSTFTPSVNVIARKRVRTDPFPVSASRHLQLQGRHEVQFPISTMPTAPAVHVYRRSTFLLTKNVVPVTVGNTDPNVVETKLMEGEVVNRCGENDAFEITGGEQQKKKEGNVDGHHESVEVEKDGAGVGAGGKNTPLLYMYVEEILMEEDPLHSDKDLCSAITSLGSEDFSGDEDVGDDTPSSSTGSSSN